MGFFTEWFKRPDREELSKQRTFQYINTNGIFMDINPTWSDQYDEPKLIHPTIKNCLKK